MGNRVADKTCIATNMEAASKPRVGMKIKIKVLMVQHMGCTRNKKGAINLLLNRDSTTANKMPADV